jgi:fluoride exporter
MPVTLAVAFGGALGATARYALDSLIERRSESVFPWSTFTINVSGCLLIGIVVAALVDRHHTPAWLRIGLTVGVLGGYTTFSTFAQEAFGLLDGRDKLVTVTYALGSVNAGVAAVYAGTRLGHAL